ncbi:MAG: PAS domain S-box protein [Candidatus Bipolaricaulia bacterium]
MKRLTENLVVQFSVISFVIILALALAIILIFFSTSLNRNIELLRDHSDAMVAGTLKPADPYSIPSISQNVRNLRWLTYGAIGIGFVVLYFSLVFIVWRGWRTINRQKVTINNLRITATDGIIMFAKRGLSIITTSPSAEAIFGYQEHQLIGQSIGILLKPQENGDSVPQDVDPRLPKLLAGERHEVVGQRADGSNFPMEVVMTKAELGRASFYTGTFRDITEQKRLREQELAYLQQIKQKKQRADELLDVVIPIGVAMSAERDFDRLLEMILLEAKSLCNADAGTLYLRTEDDRLKFVIVRTDSLNLAMGGTTGKEASLPPLRLYDETTGEPNRRNVCTYATLTGESINISDVYQAERFDFSGTRDFDKQTSYRSTSMLTVPLKDNRDQVIGVIQLINAQHPETGEVIPFDPGAQQMVEALSSLATAALEAYIREQKLKQQIEELRIEIDETKKAREVAEITDTDYFQQLKQKSKELRNKRERSHP